MTTKARGRANGSRPRSKTGNQHAVPPPASDRVRSFAERCPSRLIPGQGVCGPDYPGCINSGAAPCLYASRRLASLRAGKVTTKRFVVGSEAAVQAFNDARPLICGDRIWRDPRGKGRTSDYMRTVYLYGDYAAARAKFVELCEAMQADRDAVREERRRLVEAAKTGDASDMLALAAHRLDHGAGGLL